MYTLGLVNVARVSRPQKTSRAYVHMVLLYLLSTPEDPELTPFPQCMFRGHRHLGPASCTGVSLERVVTFRLNAKKNNGCINFLCILALRGCEVQPSAVYRITNQ